MFYYHYHVSFFAVRHSNKRLIDAKMVTWEGARWVTFQVTEAVRRIIMRGKRNGGFEVHVRDMEENILDAKSIIDPTVCSSINSKSYIMYNLTNSITIIPGKVNCTYFYHRLEVMYRLRRMASNIQNFTLYSHKPIFKTDYKTIITSVHVGGIGKSHLQPATRQV